MLNALRHLASTWLGKVLGAFLIVGLAGFGISNVLLDLGSNTVAKVGDEEITTKDFQRAYQQQVNAFAQQFGQVPTSEMAVQFGIPSAVISQLASDAAVNHFANGLNLGLSETKRIELLRKDPNFAGTLGAFDASSFARVLQQNGLTEAEYFEIQTKAARRQQIELGLFAGVPGSKTSRELVHRYQNDKRAIEYFTLSANTLASIPTPTDAELAAFLTEHQATYRTAEARTADVLVLTPEILAAGKTPTEDEIQAEYERTKARLVTVEKRDVKQVVLPNDAAIKIFEDARAAGQTFDAAVAASALSVTDLGTLAKSEITDTNLANAAFGLANAGDFTIIAGIGGKRAIGVTAIQPASETSYEDARADIAKSLALAAARTDYVDILDQIEELRAAFKPIKDIADRYKLPLAHVTLGADGAALSNVSGLPEASRQRVATAIFAAERDKLAPAISISANENVWFDLDQVEPARDQTLDEVRDAVATAWTNAKTDEALKAEVASIIDELDGGKAFFDIAAERNLLVSMSQPTGRQGDSTATFNAAVANAVFTGGPDSHGSAVDGDGAYLIYHVIDIVPADGEADAQLKSAVDSAIRDSLYVDFIDGLRTTIGVSINQQALGQLLALDSSAP